MQDDDATREAERALRLCAACLYCDDYCAVFPAIAGKHDYSLSDIGYLANLCHNCRGCYHACQYAPPHQFALNLPKALAKVRQRSYAGYARPRWLGRAFADNATVVGVVTLLSIIAVLLAADPAALLAATPGDGAFYRVLPREVMVTGAVAALAFSLGALTLGTAAFWRAIAPDCSGAELLRALPRALADAVTLRYLGGGDGGCGDRIEAPSRARRLFHHLMVGGLLLSIGSTAVAALYHHWLHWEAPYPLVSLPVALGLVGGVVTLIGVGGLIALKLRADRAPSAAETLAADYAMLALIGATAASGLALLAFRDSAAMGLWLTVHLGLVLALFLLLPVAKLVHGPYRLAALLRAAIERNANSSPERAD
uniref:CitB domain protein n=1 Tax=Rhodopseudomonas palustris (strain BisA53) TaxID=316055 RepID=Q07PG5_RHOP5